MNRREALSVMGGMFAGLLCPTWMVTPAKRRVDLTKFCGTDGRYHLKSPFLQQGWTYATDGRVAVRVAPISGDKKEGGELNLPPASRLAWQHDRLRGWRPLPKVEVPTDLMMCHWDGDESICDGGILRETCDQCWDDNAKYIGPCEQADCDLGCVRRRVCPECKGRGKVIVDGAVRIPGFTVGGEYYRKVAALGDVEYTAVDQVDSRCHRVSAIAFRFSEGFGLWMPCESE